MKKWLLGDVRTAPREGCVWNMIASVINASEAVVILMIATRTVGVEMSGVLTIAFTVANLMMCLGKYGVRNYQVTDVRNEFSFADYQHSRIITMAIMFAGTLSYLGYAMLKSQYSISKVAIVFLVTCIYGIEAYEDVYLAGLQHDKRLDIGTKMFSVRWFATLVIWGIGLIFTKSALWSTLVAAICDALFMVWLIRVAKEGIEDRNNKVSDKKDVFGILKKCLPLCITSFTAIYLPNAAKYAIDQCLGDAEQAYYGFVAMPVFVIDILSFIIFQPMLLSMSQDWNDNRFGDLKKRIRRLCGLILAISCAVLIGGFVLGIPLLSLLYGVDLSSYKMEMMVLLFGGAALGYIGLFISILTIMRRQKYLMTIYIIISLVALVTMNIFVTKYGMMGAAGWNSGLLIVLGVLLGFGCLHYMRRQKVLVRTTSDDSGTEE